MATMEAHNERYRNRARGAGGYLSFYDNLHRAHRETWSGFRGAMSRSSFVVSMVEQLARHLRFASQEGRYSIGGVLVAACNV